jgi:hypothetical protein
MKMPVAVAALLALSLSACGDAEPLASSGKPTAASDSGTQASPPPATGPTCDGGPAVSMAEELDYADFVVMRGQYYYNRGRSEQAVTLGPVVGKVRCQLIGSGTRREYEKVDGDAAGLPAGTSIYTVAGQDPAKMLATKTADGVEVWQPE